MNQRLSKAFSLIEMMIVTFVVVVGFMAIMTLVQKMIGSYYSNKNQLLGAVLAQEGLELTRYVRDQNWMIGKDTTFSHSISKDAADPQMPSQGGDRAIFRIDSRVLNDDRRTIELVYSNGGAGSCISGNISECITDDRNKVYLYDDASGRQYYIQPNSGDTLDPKYQGTVFHRLVETAYNDGGTPGDVADDYLYVKVMVYWQDRGQQKFYTINTYLTNYSLRYKQ
ncbi:MAG: type II secretion system protein [Candidatus Falkowbacteria bacterium]